MNKPKGKRKTQDPCEICFLHRDRCICKYIPELNLKTRVSLIIHAKELKRTTNTGRLACAALRNSEIFVRGRIDQPLNLENLLQPNYRTLLFYPAPDARELSAQLIAESPLPIHLLVPDGNWRQASKVHYRHAEIAHVPRVSIKTPNESAQHLRAESSPEGMATLQAIAHALGIIESADVKSQLLKLYQLKLEQTLKSRGVKDFQE